MLNWYTVCNFNTNCVSQKCYLWTKWMLQMSVRNLSLQISVKHSALNHILHFSRPPSGPRPGPECSGCGTDHLPGGQAHVCSTVCSRRALPVKQCWQSRPQLLPPSAPLLLPDPEQWPVRLQTTCSTSLLDLAWMSQVRHRCRLCFTAGCITTFCWI